MSVTHTPGPWSVVHKRAIERPIHIREHFAVRPADGPTFAFLPEGRADIQEANARLVAAAPDLLKALKAIYAYTLPASHFFEGTPEFRAALDAIAKAEGGAA